jgi:KipI family sensor histidine kinase inhibitor
MSQPQYPRYLPAGDQGLVVEFGDTIDPAINRRVRALFLALQAGPAPSSPDRPWDPASAGFRIPGIVDLVPTYRSLLITYDPLRLPLDDLQRALITLEERPGRAPMPTPRILEIPTAYGGPFGPDLAFVASHNGLRQEEVVAIHCGTDYLVYMMGFSPGFPYLGGMSERIATPRLETPRTAIPAGSVGIAQTQTGIYPVESPGGWQLIGRTPVALFDAARHPPVLIEAGDYLRFVPIDAAEYEDLANALAAGTWQIRLRELRAGGPSPA